MSTNEKPGFDLGKLKDFEMHVDIEFDEESMKILKEMFEKAEQERRKKLPEKYISVIALLKFDDVPPGYCINSGHRKGDCHA